jgi:LPXTG-motif cell wall-anchored protein
LKEWNNLPISVQNEVNTILMSATGVSYQALLQQAQQIASGAINRVNTGVDTQAGLFGLLAGISAAAAGLFYRKQRGR